MIWHNDPIEADYNNTYLHIEYQASRVYSLITLGH